MKSPNEVSLRPEVVPSRAPELRLGYLLVSILLAASGLLVGLMTNLGPTDMHLHLAGPVAKAFNPAVELDTRATERADTVFEPPRSERPESIMPMNLIVHTGEHSYAVLASGVDAEIGSGEFLVERDFQVQSFLQPIATQNSDVPTSIDVYGKSSFVCRAEAGEQYLLQQIASEDGPEMLDGWVESDEGLLLAVRLLPTRGDCQKGVWARDAKLSAPSLARRVKIDSTLRKMVVRKVRDSPEYRAIQADFESDGHSGAWHRFDSGRFTVSHWRSAGEDILAVSAQVGGCGYFSAQLSQMYKIGSDGTVERMPAINADFSQISAAADVDADGELEFVADGEFYDTMVLRSGPALVRTIKNEVPIFYCTC